MKFKVNGMLNKVSSKCKDFYRKNNAEIFLIGGVISVIGGVIAGCIATTKVDDILDTHEVNRKNVENAVKEGEIRSKKEENREITKVYARTVLSTARVYLPCAILTASGITMLLKSHSIMKKRNAALVAAFETVNNAFNKYRERVVSKYGEEVDEELYYGTDREEICETGKNGKKKVVGEEVYYPDELPGFDRYFDKYNLNFQNEEKYGEFAMRANFMFLHGKEDYFNNIKELHDFVLLNDIYDSIGIPRSSAGCRMGWLTRKGAEKVGRTDLATDYLSFGIDWDNVDKSIKVVRHSDGELEKRILLKFNVAPAPIDSYISKLSGTEAFI